MTRYTLEMTTNYPDGLEVDTSYPHATIEQVLEFVANKLSMVDATSWMLTVVPHRTITQP